MSGFYRAPITPGQTWFSPVGGGNTPAAGGTITTYLAGTSTLVATYADNAGGTSNGSTITLNAAGRLPTAGAGSDVWIPGGVAIKMVVLDAVGNPIDTDDNVTGINDPAFASGGFSEWITGPAATWINSTTFSCLGDQVSLGPLNRDRRIEITSGAGTTRATITSTVYDVPSNLTTVTFEKDANDPTPTNPITALRYGILSMEATSFPSAALQLAAPRRRAAGNTNVLLYGPIGSNLVTFSVQFNLVASGGGAGNQIVTGTVNGVVGSLTFNKTAHGRITGQVVQVATSNTLPVNVVASTSYIVFRVDANNYGLYAVPSGWQFEQPYLDPVTNPGGLTWGNPIAFSTAGVGNQTVTPGFVAPTGVTRVYAEVIGAGGGGGGSRGNTGDGGSGVIGGNTTFSSFTAPGGGGGQGGSATVGGQAVGAGTIATGGQINTFGNGGDAGDFTAAAAGSAVVLGGRTVYPSANIDPSSANGFGCGGQGAGSTAANQGGGRGGTSGSFAAGYLAVTSGTWIAASCGAGGTAGAAGTGTGSAAGGIGGDGAVIVWW